MDRDEFASTLNQREEKREKKTNNHQFVSVKLVAILSSTRQYIVINGITIFDLKDL